MLSIVVFEGVSLSMNGLRKKRPQTRIINKIFKQGIGIAGKAKTQKGIAGMVM